ncbi:MAG: carbonate dehydratase [Thermodesulfobacteriota bacterium]|nr:MAG: carbonate dehydratase [Thermodesulfobacteriota bacterium]
MDVKKLLQRNRQWAEKIKEGDPDFFVRLAKEQRPQFLWLGCSDSRVPAVEVVDLRPGSIFEHRNIANMVIHSDFNCLAVVHYAVEVLGVRDIVVCGHYGCGGIRAAMEEKVHGLIDNWLCHIKDVYRYHQEKIDVVGDEDDKMNLLCEINVAEQVANLCRTTVVLNAWKSGRDLSVHGWVYDIGSGLLKDLGVSASSAEGVSSAHRFK